MNRDYPITEVHTQWDINLEDMGTKDKFWFLIPPDTDRWLFKFPRKDTGEHWSEKIAYEIARKMKISAAKVELAIFHNASEKHQGTATLSFLDRGENLIHGNQILAIGDMNYDPDQRWRQNMHTAKRILSSIDFLGKAVAHQCKTKLAEYLVLDAVIGNGDRHHENWGILRTRGKRRYKIAPTFDHASSLGRELNDTGGKNSRERYLRELGINVYERRARGAIFIDEADKWGASPLELVRWCVQSEYRPFFIRALDKVKRLDEGSVRDIIDRIPSDWMSPLAREFPEIRVRKKTTSLNRKKGEVSLLWAGEVR